MGFWRDTMLDRNITQRVEYKLDWEASLGWAISAKNSLQSVHGFSPFQLVFGRNPNLPNILEDKPPALEGTTSSEIVAKPCMLQENHLLSQNRQNVYEGR